MAGWFLSAHTASLQKPPLMTVANVNRCYICLSPARAHVPSLSIICVCVFSCMCVYMCVSVCVRGGGAGGECSDWCKSMTRHTLKLGKHGT